MPLLIRSVFFTFTFFLGGAFFGVFSPPVSRGGNFGLHSTWSNYSILYGMGSLNSTGGNPTIGNIHHSFFLFFFKKNSLSVGLLRQRFMRYRVDEGYDPRSTKVPAPVWYRKARGQLKLAWRAVRI